MSIEYRIKMTEEDLEKIRSILMAHMPREAGVFLLAGIRENNQTKELLVRRVVEIPETEYKAQESYYLEISPRAINGIIALCEKTTLGVVLCHSHPLHPNYSRSDNYGEKRIAKTLWQFLPNAPVGSLLMTPTIVRGRFWEQDGTSRPISSIISVGRHIKKIPTIDSKSYKSDSTIDIYDRQIRVFGTDGQKAVSGTKVGIVGLGGTGSSVAEQLVRLGVKDLVLIDKDEFESSNLTRIYGSFYKNSISSKERKNKVNIICNHLKKINPRVQVKKIRGNVVTNTCSNLLDRDVIFCCTDDHWGRSIINQITYQYLIPTINMGVRIDSENEKIKDAGGAIHVLRPGKPCLWCYDFLKAKRIGTESLPIQERKTLLREGYVENIDTPSPSVISLTTTVSGIAVTLFLQLVTDFMGASGDIYCLRYDIMNGTVSRGKTDIKLNCICNAVKGYGDLKSIPIITQARNGKY